MDAALAAYHQAETALDEGRIALEGHTIQAERARAAAANHMQEHHLALLEDLEPAAEKAMAKKRDLATQLVAVEAELNTIRSQAAQYISASGHSPQGNVPIPDALSEMMGVVQDIASGVRPPSYRQPAAALEASQRHRGALPPPGQGGPAAGAGQAQPGEGPGRRLMAALVGHVAMAAGTSEPPVPGRRASTCPGRRDFVTSGMGARCAARQETRVQFRGCP